MREFELLRRIQARLPAGPDGVVIGSGDDAALLDPGGRRVVATTDALVAGVHFDAGADPADVGFKAMAVNLSDVAAMGARPWVALATYGMPGGGAAGYGEALLAGMLEAAAPHDVGLVGGDIVRAPVAFVSLTLLGLDVCGRVVGRDGARPGDRLLVTGALGGSRLGRHLRPVARVAEGLLLNPVAHAMIDLSDGLAGDLAHVARMSGVGAEVDARRLPLTDACHACARASGRPAFEHGLTDGEDFELLVACPPESAALLLADPPGGTPLTDIGRITEAAEGLQLIDLDGRRAPLTLRGFEHAG